MLTHKFHKLALSALLAGILGITTGPAAEAATLKLNFMTHAAFFSEETKQPKPLDPQVFVRDPAAAAATGPQGIKHAAGVRPPFIEQDPRTEAVFNAEDKPLGFTLGDWLGATGSVTLEEGSPAKLSATFSGLRPGGHYSLFENHFDQSPIGFTPMDGAGTANNFVAKSDGTAAISMIIPHVPAHANGVLLVYHSDGKDHGKERGTIGVNAHHQLIVRPQ